jgi:parvulin-like peptidyl-prolyl isomerase
MRQQPLTEEQEREVKQLAQAIAEAASQEFEQLARTLVGSGDSPFGQAEFTIRDILLRVGAKAYEQHLEQKKTTTRLKANGRKSCYP